jgi:hypothetical protein
MMQCRPFFSYKPEDAQAEDGYLLFDGLSKQAVGFVTERTPGEVDAFARLKVATQGAPMADDPPPVFVVPCKRYSVPPKAQ